MAELTAPPVLSTPAENLFDVAEPLPDFAALPRRTDDELRNVYEVLRTAREIHAAQRRRVALQFPDAMLCDAPRVVGLLQAALTALHAPGDEQEKIYILADTSYSACCVDEVAAEHADADVVVHYGRACLSPTTRLPVVYVFTRHRLDETLVAAAFAREFSSQKDEKADKKAPTILMADVTYQDHVPAVHALLQQQGYDNVLATEVVHNPLGALPNRRLIDAKGQPVADDAIDWQACAVFHVAAPPTSLLLALATKVRAFYVYPAEETENENETETKTQTPPSVLAPTTRGMLGRRYAKVLKMATAGVIGILVNTLSVRNYLEAVDNMRRRIAHAGKKSYLVVVGKLNPVKLANFAEIDGWVVVGCWESSLVEDDTGFYQPVVTPFELEMALMPDDERIWGLKWWGGLEGLSDVPDEEETKKTGDDDDESESEIPQFDLRTGRLVTNSRPMRMMKKKANGTKETNGTNGTSTNGTSSGALTLRGKAELATINGVVSPGAEFLRSQRTWQGLGTDFNDAEEEPSTLVEEGRSGIARGYTVGDEAHRT